MIFSNYSFFIFYSIVLFFCVIIQQLPTIKNELRIHFRNALLLVASYYFYAFLKWEFVILLFIVTLVNYICSIFIEKERKRGHKNKSRHWMWVAVISSVGILGYFKYANFFIESVNNALILIGIEPKLQLLKIILPVGISFFTFQALTYTLDIYKEKLAVRKNFFKLALFVSFFPTILSGPIEKARNLMPQLEVLNKITLDRLIEGGKLFLWGLFKKIVIADRLAAYINIVYADTHSHSSLTLFITAIFYSFQIYADFSGYTDMAIGIGKTLGFNLSQNFNFPYFATSFKDFWKKWHISLTSWFTEYLYIPLGGNRVKTNRWIMNISSVFLLSGLWHGANWSFIIWGALHAIYYLIEHFTKQFRQIISSRIARNILGRYFLKLISVLLVFLLVSIAWIFFRIEDTLQVLQILKKIIHFDNLSFYFGSSAFSTILAAFLLIIFIILDYIKYKQFKISPYLIVCGYSILLCLVLLFGATGEGFVYFQF